MPSTREQQADRERVGADDAQPVAPVRRRISGQARRSTGRPLPRLVAADEDDAVLARTPGRPRGGMRTPFGMISYSPGR